MSGVTGKPLRLGLALAVQGERVFTQPAVAAMWPHSSSPPETLHGARTPRLPLAGGPGRGR